MQQPNKPMVRVTQLEAFRRWIDQSETAPYEIPEQSVIDSVTRAFSGNEYTRIGTAFHYIVETGQPKCEKVDGGRAFFVDDHMVQLSVAQCKMALAYRNEHPQAFHEVRLYKDYGPAIVTGKADMVDGLEIRDIKTKFATPQDADYIDSCQWRYYLELFDLDVFHFDLFIFEGYNKDKHGYDVRPLTMTRREPITCYRYPGMEQDNANLLNAFMEWVENKHLTEYLTQNKQEL